MVGSNKTKKKLTPAKRKRRQQVMINRAIFAAACAAFIALIIFIGYFLVSFIKKATAPSSYVISGQNASDTNDGLNDTQDYYYIDGDFTVCLDAGHGGEDSGAVDFNGGHESLQTLEMTLMLKEELENLGIKVLLTRDSDSYISLSERCDIANTNNADLMLSIHRNFFADDTSICGIEAWIHSSCPENDYDIAEKILNELVYTGVTENRGIKYGTRDDSHSEDYAINDMSQMPSLILEMGYMSNDEDNKLFYENMNDYCKSIAVAISKWYKSQTQGGEE